MKIYFLLLKRRRIFKLSINIILKNIYLGNFILFIIFNLLLVNRILILLLLKKFMYHVKSFRYFSLNNIEAKKTLLYLD